MRAAAHGSAVQLPTPVGFDCVPPKGVLVCMLWACRSPSGKGLADRSGGGFKVPFTSQGLWLLT